MAEIATTVRQLGANSATVEVSTFAAADTITYATLLADLKVFAAAQKHKVTNLKGGQLFSFLSTSYGSAADALTAFAKAGGVISVIASNGSTTALPVLKVGQSALVALIAATGAGCAIRISLAQSIDA